MACWRPENLQRALAAVHGGRRTAHTNKSAAQLEYRTAVNHQGDAFGHLQRTPVFQSSVRSIKTNLIRHVVIERRFISICPTIADDPNNLAACCGSQGVLDEAKWTAWHTISDRWLYTCVRSMRDGSCCVESACHRQCVRCSVDRSNLHLFIINANHLIH